MNNVEAEGFNTLSDLVELNPTDEILAQLGFAQTVMLQSSGGAEAEVRARFAISFAIDDAGVRVIFDDLFDSLLNRLVASADKFVFPADEACFGKERTQTADDFECGLECEREGAETAGDFIGLDFVSGAVVCLGNAEIAQRGDVENDVDLEVLKSRKGFEMFL